MHHIFNIIVWHIRNTFSFDNTESIWWIFTVINSLAHWSILCQNAPVIWLTWTWGENTSSKWPTFFSNNTNINSPLTGFRHVTSVTSIMICTIRITLNYRIWWILYKWWFRIVSGINSVFAKSCTELSNSRVSPARTTLSLIENVRTTIIIITIEIIVFSFFRLFTMSTRFCTIFTHPWTCCIICRITELFNTFTNWSNIFSVACWLTLITSLFTVFNIILKPTCCAITLVILACSFPLIWATI